MDNFPCSGCGACCQKVGFIVKYAQEAINSTSEPVPGYIKEAAEFPFKTDPSGRCEMLDDNNRCKVYDTRPDICRIDKQYERYHTDKESRRQFWQRTAAECNNLMDFFDIPEKMRIYIK